MQAFIGENWRNILALNQFDTFDAIWNNSNDWVEKPNVRRGGWSGVSRVELPDAQGAIRTLYVKRQEGQPHRTLAHPFKGQLTFEREFNSMLKLRRKNIPMPDLVYFARQKHDKNQRAILITENLADFICLEDACNQLQWPSSMALPQKILLMQQLVAEIKKFHQAGMQHGCLYAKHVFVSKTADKSTIKIAFIDFEKARKRVFLLARMVRDLRVLQRDIPSLSYKDKLRFYKIYTDKVKLTGFDRWLLDLMYKKSKRKGK